MSGARASGRIRGRTISALRAEISVVPAAAGSELPCASHPEHVRVNLVVSGADSLPGGFLEGGAPGSLGRSAGRTAEPICCQWRRQNPLRESRSRSRTTAAVPLLLTNGKMLQNCSFQKFQDPKAMQQRCAGRDFAQARQEGEEAHAAGLPLLGSVYAAFLPMQGVRAAPAPRRPRA
jgi:hypothetical protein